MEGTEEQQGLANEVISQEQEEVVMETNGELSITEGTEGEPTCDQASRKTDAEEDAGVDPSGEDSLTTQWSVEDEEEIARERRRRAREEQLRKDSENGIPGDSTAAENEQTTDEAKFHYKTTEQNELEEDEGFSDWTQRLDRQRQKQTEEHAFEVHHNVNETREGVCTQKEQVDYLEQEEVRCTHYPAGLESEETVDSQYSQRGEAQYAEDDIWTNSPDEKFVKRENESIAEFSSDIHLQREMRSSSLSQDEDDGFREAEAKLEKIRKSLEEKENLEFEHLKQKQLEAEAELEELKKRREERRQLREKVEYSKQQEEFERQVRQEEEKQRMREDIERRRIEATERMKKLSTSGSEGEELLRPISPRSPTSKTEKDDRAVAETTFSITERTEHLNRSIKKSNSIKKTHPVLPVAKIEDKLEQYTHAIESSGKGPKHTGMDMPSVSEPVSAKKNLFESPDALSNMSKSSPCKDTDGLNVGVADRIHQWAKDTSETNVKYPATAASDIMPGDVGSIKNLWEQKGDSPSSKTPSSATKGTCGNKKYKYVPTGHGKYEKVPVEDGEMA